MGCLTPIMSMVYIPVCEKQKLGSRCMKQGQSVAVDSKYCVMSSANLERTVEWASVGLKEGVECRADNY